jgi:hypothetical protein
MKFLKILIVGYRCFAAIGHQPRSNRGVPEAIDEGR